MGRDIESHGVERLIHATPKKFGRSLTRNVGAVGWTMQHARGRHVLRAVLPPRPTSRQRRESFARVRVKDNAPRRLLGIYRGATSAAGEARTEKTSAAKAVHSSDASSPISSLVPPMNLRQLRYFVTVVDAGSFSRAAQIAHVAQPALSLQIAGLEESLGASARRSYLCLVWTNCPRMPASSVRSSTPRSG
ncbi:MAG TPA: LysR family transcriptional regulator [Paraburkholderia sp.]|nr:LysR family transcriptional regulator [Paraburkholderia sp.]